MAAVWSYCTETKSYCVSREMLAAIGDHQNFSDFIVQSDLGEASEEGIRIRGTKGRIEWLHNLRKNGRKGGRPKKNQTVTRTKPDGNQTVTRSEPESNPLTLTLALTPTLVPTLSLKTENEEELNLAAGSKRAASQPGLLPSNEIKKQEAPSSRVWEAYSRAYEGRYGEKPVRNATVNAQLKQFVARIPAEEAPAVAEFYLSHRDQYYVKQMHPVGVLLKDAEKLRTEWATQRQMTTTEARHAEKGAYHANQLDRIKRGEL